jgi:hypothetical protein
MSRSFEWPSAEHAARKLTTSRELGQLDFVLHAQRLRATILSYGFCGLTGTRTKCQCPMWESTGAREPPQCEQATAGKDQAVDADGPGPGGFVRLGSNIK